MKLAQSSASAANLRLVGADLDEAKDEAAGFATAGLPFFEDGAEPAQYAGYAVIGHEILDQLPREPRRLSFRLGTAR